MTHRSLFSKTKFKNEASIHLNAEKFMHIEEDMRVKGPTKSAQLVCCCTRS